MSERLDFKGDYMGFSYGVTQPDGTERLTHSSTLGIVRTSDGSRFNENLLPTIQDKTVQVPGGDGTYFFGSYYTQRQFSVSFAFDSLTEEQIAEIRRVFGDKQIHDLIFDERPYKVYSAKVTGTATIKYIAFAEGASNRLYKGEGTIQFTCYNPFARCWSNDQDEYFKLPIYGIFDPITNKYLERDEMSPEDSARILKRIEEWWDASRIVYNGGNFGDVPVPFKKTITDTEGSINFGNISWKGLPKNAYIKANTTGGFDVGKIYYKKEKGQYVEATETEPILGNQYYIEGVVLDTKIGIVKDADGNIYNKYFTGDLTAKIPKDATVEETDGLEFTCLYI